MTRTHTAWFAIALLLGSASGAAAQDGHAMGQTAPDLPEACLSAAQGGSGMMMESTPESAGPQGMDEGHQALMASMEPMNSGMSVGMMAEDIDVAFVCGMISHHQGAIDMAKAELQYGDDDWARTMAQKVIDAQEQEIAEMKTWLEELPE